MLSAQDNELLTGVRAGTIRELLRRTWTPALLLMAAATSVAVGGAPQAVAGGY